VLTVLFLIDMGLGLMNRFAQQLNVFTLSMSIKAIAATAVLLLLMTGYVTAIIRDVASRPEILHQLMQGLK
jgi:type III secretion protein T